MIPFLLLQWRKFVIGFHGMDAMKIKIRLPQNSSFLFPCFLACSNQRRWTHWSVMSRKSHISFLRLYPSSHPLVSHFYCIHTSPTTIATFLFSALDYNVVTFSFLCGRRVAAVSVCVKIHTYFYPKKQWLLGVSCDIYFFQHCLYDSITNIHKDFPNYN